jgi:protein-S-isoprenylcysteine O-methyltransferase Ste14
MDALLSTESWLSPIVIGAYLFQVIMLVFFPVPSSFSTISLLSKGGIRKGKTLVLALLAVSASMIALLPLGVLFYPKFFRYLLMMPIAGQGFTTVLSAFFLSLGNGLMLPAVLILRRKAALNRAGETERLVTTGLFGAIRNPIAAGIGLVFIGLILAFPSYVMLSGFIAFAFNQNCRITMEEADLEKRFGRQYLIYKENTGRFFPAIRRLGKNLRKKG